jgi:hypothetical protein
LVQLFSNVTLQVIFAATGWAIHDIAEFGILLHYYGEATYEGIPTKELPSSG